MIDAGLGALTGVLHLIVVALVVGPVAWWVARRRGASVLAERGGRTLVLGAGIYVGSLTVLHLPRVGPFADLAWNWQNKLLLVLALTILVTAWDGVSWRQVGVVMPAPGWWRPVLMVIVGVIGFQAIAGPMGDPGLSVETVAFQALIPGLDEELLFRGVLLVLFDRAHRARRHMWGREVGWGTAITTLLFGLLHGLNVGADLVIEFDAPSIIATGTVGLLLVWVRVSTASLWPAVLLHNAINLSVVAMASLAH